MSERTAKFRLTDRGDYVIELRLASEEEEPPPDLGGGTIRPGELGVVGDDVEQLPGDVYAAFTFTIAADSPSEYVVIDTAAFRRAFDDFRSFQLGNTGSIEPGDWGIDVPHG
jgi:hypothetical protein